MLPMMLLSLFFSWLLLLLLLLLLLSLFLLMLIMIAGLLLRPVVSGCCGSDRGRQEPKAKSSSGSPLLYRPYNLKPKPALDPEPEKLNSDP